MNLKKTFPARISQTKNHPMPQTTYIYHERQMAALCGQHSLNNLLQRNHFAPSDLGMIAEEMDREELRIMAQNDEGGTSSKSYLRRMAEGSGNVDSSGNFSIQVLSHALSTMGITLNLRHPRTDTSYGNKEEDITETEGFIMNRHAHWFTIRKLNGKFWNLNSLNERPEVISHFRLAAEVEALQGGGWDVFYVSKGSLPPAFTFEDGDDRYLSEAQREQMGPLTYWWREEDLVAGNAKSMSSDPWANLQGSGMRLDGGGGNSAAAGSSSNVPIDVDGLTEEEQIAFAISASLSAPDPDSDPNISEELFPAPLQTAANAVRIQFRLPDGSKKVRYFDSTKSVSQIYLFVSQESGVAPSGLELRAFYPSKSIESNPSVSIMEAKLSGESINCRRK